MPVFDFEAHRPFPHRRSVTLKENGIALVEGIHALNPVLIGRLPSLKVKRIYISVKQGIQDGERPLLGPNDMRLIRRIVRDYGFRKTGPERTLGMWGTVMAGERNYIKPFRNLADFTVNSFHVYEPCVLRDQAIRLLHTVSEGSGCFGEARGLLAVLERFRPIDSGLVPRDSILREFIGPAGSVS
jgi:uridine kinase